MSKRTTITGAGGRHGIRLGDIIELSDDRSWWKKFWDWVWRGRGANLYHVVIEVEDTVITIEEMERWKSLTGMLVRGAGRLRRRGAMLLWKD